MALRAATPGGRVVALGLASAPAQPVPLAFVRRGLTLVGSLIYEDPTDFQRAISAVPAALEAFRADHRSGKTLIDIAGVAE